MGCNHRCCRSWTVSLHGLTQPFLKGHGDQERFLISRKRLHLSSMREGRESRKLDAAVLSQFLERLRGKSSSKPFPSPYRMREGLGTASNKLPQASDSQPTWMPSATQCLAPRTRQEQTMFTLTFARSLTSWNIHIPKLMMHGLDKWMLKGVKFTDNFLFKNLQGDQTPQRGYKISALGHVQNSAGDPFPEGS